MLSTSVDTILGAFDTPTQHRDTPVVNCAKTIAKDQDIISINMSLDIYDPSLTVPVPLTGDHQQLGFIIHSNLRTHTIQDCEHGIPANDIEQWCSRFQNATIRAINGETIDNIVQF